MNRNPDTGEIENITNAARVGMLWNLFASIQDGGTWDDIYVIRWHNLDDKFKSCERANEDRTFRR